MITQRPKQKDQSKNKEKRKRKNKNKHNIVKITTVQKEYCTILKKNKTDIYIRSEKRTHIYYERILKLLNSSKDIDNLIEGVKNKRPPVNEECNEITIYAVGSNILKASYLVQDIMSFYFKTIKNIVDHSTEGKNNKKIDVTSLIDINVDSKTLIMNDNRITEKFKVRKEFLEENYDSLIKFAMQPYSKDIHNYKEEYLERRVTNVIITIKKKKKNKGIYF